MFKSFLLSSCIVGLSLVLPVVVFAQNQFDQVHIDGQPTASRGTITSMTKDEVGMDMAGVARTFPVNQINRITYADENNELTNARNAVQQKNYTAALNELKKLQSATIDRDYVKQDVAFYNALCLARMAMSEGGDQKAAQTAMLEFVKSAPNNWHFYDAAEILGELASALGDNAGAVRYYSGVAKAPWEDYRMRANNAIGNSLLSQKNAAEALTKFDEVLSASLSSPEAAAEKVVAQIGKAQCLAETGKVDEGVKMIEEVIEKNDPSDTTLFARAYNGLGNCYLKGGKTKEALQAFLHTDILFSADPQTHAEALYRLSKLWVDVNKSDRATAARSTLHEKYSGSAWSKLE
jgi:tetratricopeptide (TPR) repeat protein